MEIFFFIKDLFIFDCAGSLLMHVRFLQLRRAGATLYLKCAGFSWWWLLWQSTVPGHVGSVVGTPWLSSTGSVVVALGPSCSMAWGIFLDQGPNPCVLHWQTGSLPLSHQCSPGTEFFSYFLKRNGNQK